MQRLLTEAGPRIDSADEYLIGRVHWDAPGLLGWSTLCGEVDRIGEMKFTRTTKAVTCRDCLAVVAHVRSSKETP